MKLEGHPYILNEQVANKSCVRGGGAPGLIPDSNPSLLLSLIYYEKTFFWGGFPPRYDIPKNVLKYNFRLRLTPVRSPVPIQQRRKKTVAESYLFALSRWLQ